MKTHKYIVVGAGSTNTAEKLERKLNKLGRRGFSISDCVTVNLGLVYSQTFYGGATAATPNTVSVLELASPDEVRHDNE